MAPDTPKGLEGEAIPVGARVLALAEAWDEMTGSQGAGVKGADALATFREQRGSRFAPEVVDALVAVYGEDVSDRDASRPEGLLSSGASQERHCSSVTHSGAPEWAESFPCALSSPLPRRAPRNRSRKATTSPSDRRGASRWLARRASQIHWCGHDLAGSGRHIRSPSR